MERALGLGGGGGGGVVGVLGDHDAAHVGQGGGGVAFLGGVGPGADELHLHGDGGADALGAEVVGGEAGDDLGEGERADVADDGLVRGDVTVVDHFLHLETGNDAGAVAALVDVGEDVVGVGEVIGPGSLVRAGDEVDVGVIGGDLQHEGLEAVGVVDDDAAAFLGQLQVGVLAGGVVADVVFDEPFDVDALGGQRFGGGVLAADEVVGVALVILVADADEADLDALGLAVGGGLSLLAVLGRGLGVSLGVGFGSLVVRRGLGLGLGVGVGSGIVAGAAGDEAEHHDRREQQRDQFFHVGSSSKILDAPEKRRALITTLLYRKSENFTTATFTNPKICQVIQKI